MKILVFSDSHGRVSPMMDQIRLHQPDLVFHLGDVTRDVLPLRQEWPNLRIESVPGNCDGWTDQPEEKLITVEGFRFLLCHGHTYRVKLGLDLLREGARTHLADAALFGHTHSPLCDRSSGFWLFNPGSIGCSPRQSYGIITIEHGRLRCDLAQGREA